MDETKTEENTPAKKKLGLPEICEMITIAEARLGRILSPMDFGHDDMIHRTNPEINLPSLPELRRILCISGDESAYQFVMRASNHTTSEIMRAIHREPPRENPPPNRVKRASTTEERPPPVMEPEKPAAEPPAPPTEPPPPLPVIEQRPEPIKPRTIVPTPPRKPVEEQPKVDTNAVRPLRPKKGWGDVVPIKKPESE